jgi:hypothetical protein
MMRCDAGRAGSGRAQVAMRMRARNRGRDQQRDHQQRAHEARRAVPHAAHDPTVQVATGRRRVKSSDAEGAPSRTRAKVQAVRG